MTIQVKGLRKKYFNKEAVKGVDFTIEPESIIGLLGRNGAGKSTVLNMIARRIEKTSGDITLDGVDLHKLQGRCIKCTYRVQKIGSQKNINLKIYYLFIRKLIRNSTVTLQKI